MSGLRTNAKLVTVLNASESESRHFDSYHENECENVSVIADSSITTPQVCVCLFPGKYNIGVFESNPYVIRLPESFHNAEPPEVTCRA